MQLVTFELIPAPSKFTHNSTFSHSARHLARWGRPHVVVHPQDARDQGLAAGDLATLSNAQGSLSLPVELSSDVPRGILRVDGMPRAVDTPEGVGVNALVPSLVSDVGDGNVLYSTRVDLGPAKASTQP